VATRRRTPSIRWLDAPELVPTTNVSGLPPATGGDSSVAVVDVVAVDAGVGAAAVVGIEDEPPSASDMSVVLGGTVGAVCVELSLFEQAAAARRMRTNTKRRMPHE